MASTTVRAGQVWESMDPRDHHAKFIVQEVAEGVAWVTNLAGKRRRKIRLDRFKEGSTGYRLYRDAATGRGLPDKLKDAEIP